MGFIERGKNVPVEKLAGVKVQDKKERHIQGHINNEGEEQEMCLERQDLVNHEMKFQLDPKSEELLRHESVTTRALGTCWEQDWELWIHPEVITLTEKKRGRWPGLEKGQYRWRKWVDLRDAYKGR